MDHLFTPGQNGINEEEMKNTAEFRFLCDMFLNKDQDEMYFSESDIIHLMNNFDLDECVQKL
jgi:hypothetical protein